jgi:Zn-dependent protease
MSSGQMDSESQETQGDEEVVLNELPDSTPAVPSAPSAPPPPPPVFYTINSTKVSHREYWWGRPNPMVLTGWLTKWLRVRIPSSTDDLNVESLRPFEASDDAAIPPDARDRMTPLLNDLLGLGFGSPVFHVIDDPMNSTRSYLATLLHPSGKAVARVHDRVWYVRVPAKRRTFVAFISQRGDGTVLVTSGARKDMTWPASVDLEYHTGAPTAELWAEQQRRLGGSTMPVTPITTREQMLAAAERHHALLRDHHLRRGVFVPYSAADHASQAAAAQARQHALATGSQHSDVLAEITKLQNQRGRGWMTGIALLVVSMFLFLGQQRTSGGSGDWRSWRTLAILAGVLFFHEAGHYIAMRMFGYRNVRMFFIPGFGAAVSGKHYNVPGWRKVIVSLMGPVPGIFVGIILGLSGLLHKPLCVEIAWMLLILNGFNLLPVLPLDGGWALHAMLFSRHPILDAAFRAAAGGLLIGAYLLLHLNVFLILGIIMLMSLPVSYLNAKITADLRRAGLPTLSPDDQTIPPPTAIAIVSRLRGEGMESKMTNTKLLAQRALQIFETINARPPGWGASLGLGLVHAGALAAAVVFGVLLVIGQRPGGFTRPFRQPLAVREPKHSVMPASIIGQGAKALAASAARRPHTVIVGTFATTVSAQKAFADLSGTAPATAEVRLFGQSVMLALPRSDDALRREWLETMRRRTADVFVVADPGPRSTLTLTCAAPDATAAEAIRQEAAEYFAAREEMHLIPPWREPERRSADEIARQRVARRTFERLRELGQVRNDADIEALKDLGRRESEARRDGDRAAGQSLRAKRREMLDGLRRRDLEQLRQDTSGAVDREVIRMFDQRDYPATRPIDDIQFLHSREAAPIAARMGQIPLAGDVPAPGADAWSTNLGFASRDGVMLRFAYVSFVDVMTGPPAMVRWLSGKGCTRIKYEFHAPLPGSGDEGEAE